MKKIAIIFISLFLLSLLMSCSTSKINNFSAQKYTNFKQSSNKISNNKEKLLKQEIIAKDVFDNNQIEDITINEKIENNDYLHAKTKSASDNDKNVTYNSIVQSKQTNKKNSDKIIKPKVKLLNSTISRSILSNPSAASVTQQFTDQLLLVILAILLPPLAVFLLLGFGNEFWLDVILTILGWLPGIIYALILILK